MIQSEKQSVWNSAIDQVGTYDLNLAWRERTRNRHSHGGRLTMAGVITLKSLESIKLDKGVSNTLTEHCAELIAVSPTRRHSFMLCIFII